MGRITPSPLLEVEGLSVDFQNQGRWTPAVRGISFQIQLGEIVCLVGESGSGKTVTGMSIPRLVPQPPGRVAAHRIEFKGQDLLQMDTEDLRRLRGSEMACVFQEPMTALSPLHRVGRQLVEALELHNRASSRSDARKQALEMLHRVGIPDAERRMSDYPYQFSGGMRQRVMIAMALIMKPDLVIADEPTTALDVTTQARIFQLMLDLKDASTSLLFITHDMGVVWEMADRVLVMRNGELVESGPVRDVFDHPQHEYTQTLLSSVPRIDASAHVSEEPPVESPLLEIDALRTWFPVRAGWFSRIQSYVKAVDGVSLAIHPGRTVALVGESGSGKSTLGRSILQLETAREGSIRYRGEVLNAGNRREVLGRNVQVIFQDPFSSLNPRMTVRDLVTEPIRELRRLSAAETDQTAQNLLQEVGMDPESAHRFPHAFSGGQRQRICIARALSVRPELVICDEAVSALDVTIQAQIIDLLQQLQKQHHIAYLFITHDLSVVKQIADYVVVMKSGRVVEEGHPQAVIEDPKDPYTRELLQAVPRIGSARLWRQGGPEHQQSVETER